MQQVATRIVKIPAILASAPFEDGFNSARKGIPFFPDVWEESTRAQWRYERGRQFALVYPGKLKSGCTVLPEAIEAYKAARDAKIIL